MWEASRAMVLGLISGTATDPWYLLKYVTQSGDENVINFHEPF